MKKLLVPTIFGVLFLLTPVFAMATSITGSVQGYNSVAQSHASPADGHISAHVAATETNFVILSDTAKGKHYLIQNADRAILARLVNQQVKVDGDVDSTSESIKANEIYTKVSDQSWKKIWSSNVNDSIYWDAFGGRTIEGR